MLFVFSLCSKMYLKKHDSVSILFADIVNFTPLTVTLSVGDLVKMLNGLFGQFDEVAKVPSLESLMINKEKEDEEQIRN